MPAERVEIGIVSKAHGVRGEVVVILHDAESTALEDVETVHVAGVARKVVQARNTGGAYLLAVEGITDRDAAAALRGAVVEVDRDALDLDEDEVLLSDLVGCKCVLEDGTAWGEIVAVEMGMQDRLIIRDGNIERQLPVVDAFIADIDLENGVVKVTPPEGLPEDPVTP
jgi:16S rRNA processing protein RimM